MRYQPQAPAVTAIRCSSIAASALALTALLVAGCGGASLPASGNPAGDARLSSSWNPQAPVRKVAPLAQTLAAAPARSLGGLKLTALDSSDQPDASAQAALKLKQSGAIFTLSTTQAAPFVQVYVRYDASAQHPTSIDTSRSGDIALGVKVEPGLLVVAVSGLHGANIDAGQPLARLSFAAGADTASLRRISTVNTDAKTPVRDLAAEDVDGDVTLNWHERCNGDYNLDGQVLASDLTPIGIHFLEDTSDPLATGWAQAEVADGNEDGRVSVQDLTPIGANVSTRIDGYNVYRTPLSGPDEDPDVEDGARWTKVENSAEPTGPSIRREFNGQKSRLSYTFQDPGLDPGDYAWYVAPVGYKVSQADGELEEGSNRKSNVAKTTVGTGGLPNATLTFEIQAPAGEFATVNDEFYLAVKVNDITQLFSANVRFEYDSSLVQFVEAVPNYSGHANFLTPPLFVGVDDVGTATAPYKLVGFNATQTQGTATVDGTGVLGYFKFKCIGAGVNTETFRFPQGSNFIFLWGSSYGVPIANPVLGPAQNMNIAN